MNHGTISVLYFSNATAWGGAEEHIVTLLRGFDRDRFRMGVVCDPEVHERFRAAVPQIDTFPLTLRHPAHLEAAVRLACLLRRRAVEILHSHLFYASLFASPVGWLCRVPVVLETPHVRERWRSGWLKGKFVVDRFAGRFVDQYIAVSESNARYLVEEKGLPASNISVIHNGCDLKRFDATGLRRDEVKDKLGIPRSARVLLVVGRLEPQKGHRVLFEALPSVIGAFPMVRLICVGDGALRAELEGMARALRLEERILFAGYQSNLPEWYAIADVSVLPSFYEGLPLVAIEALASGCGVVASAVDGTPEVVVDEKTGLTVPPGDPVSLASAICRLLGDANLRRRLGEAGRNWVRSHFSQEEQIRKTQQLYVECLERRRRNYSGGLWRTRQWSSEKRWVRAQTPQR